jgi:hypothetical protein
MALGFTNDNIYPHYRENYIKPYRKLHQNFILFTVNPVLIQSVLQAHSPDAGVEHSTSLTGTLIHS